MTRFHLAQLLAVVCCLAGRAGWSQEPGISYLFPAGGQRGTTVEARVGGLFLHGGSPLQLLGEGVAASERLQPVPTIWFEGPAVPLPGSQQAENYPKDYAARFTIAAQAAAGVRYVQTHTSQGATPAIPFVVGELPEVVEQEIDGAPLPVEVALPVTINGRTFPREDIDLWTFELQQGETAWAEVMAGRLGSPLDADLVVLDPQGNEIAEAHDSFGADPYVRFTAGVSGKYTLRISDCNQGGLQHYVYRLTVSQAPRVESCFPLGGQRGASVRFELGGANVPAAIDVALPQDVVGDWSHRLSTPGGTSEPFVVDVGDLTEVMEDPNADEQSFQAPAVLNGRIERPADRDVWNFTAKKDERWELDLAAARLGSPLDSVLVILDAEGKELARSDDLADGQTDSRLEFTAPAEGPYRAVVSERFASRGDRQFAYRLRVRPVPAPDFRLTLAAEHVSVLRKGEARLKVECERIGGFKEAIPLTVAGLPPGVTVPENLAIAAGQNAVDISFKADEKAPIRAARVTVSGRALIGEREVVRRALRGGLAGAAVSGGTPAAPIPWVALRGAAIGNVPPLDSVLLAVSLPAPFVFKGEYNVAFAPRGTRFRRYYRIERDGYDGPIRVSMADRQGRHLQGVTGDEVLVPAGANECLYEVFFPPQMEIGRTSRTNVVATAEVVDFDGSRHTVGFTSQQQNEQIVALIDPCPLGLQAMISSLACTPQGKVDVPIRIQRDKTVAGPARVELIVPPHMQGVSADPVQLGPDAEEVVLTVRFGERPGPFNMPLTIRATATYRDAPVVNEIRLPVVLR